MGSNLKPLLVNHMIKAPESRSFALDPGKLPNSRLSTTSNQIAPLTITAQHPFQLPQNYLQETQRFAIHLQSTEMSSFLLRRASRITTPFRAFSTSSTRNSFAKMTLVGRLADTPEIVATSTGREILRYAVGTSTGRGDNQKTSWFRVTSFLEEGPQRDFIAGLDKGYYNSFTTLLFSVFFLVGLGFSDFSKIRSRMLARAII